jgi:hypothetical protein
LLLPIAAVAELLSPLTAALYPSEMNAVIQTIDWQFTTDDARVRLRRLYPAFDA